MSYNWLLVLVLVQALLMTVGNSFTLHSSQLTTSSTTRATFAFLSRAMHTRALYATEDSESNAEVTTSSGNEAVKTHKGFGPPPKKKEEEPKDIGTLTYEKQAKRGVPEYNIFIRPTNGSEAEWVPVGSMTIARDSSVSQAIFEVENELLKGTFKLYAKLKSYYEINKKNNNVFEYGYCLKAFPDEQITVVSRPDPNSEDDKKPNFFSDW